jgi:hypothetical protein
MEAAREERVCGTRENEQIAIAEERKRFREP